MTLAFLLLLIGVARAAPPAPDVEVLRLDADPLRGQLAAIDEQSLRLESPSGAQSVGMDTVLAITFPAGVGPPAEIGAYAATAEGSQLLARDVTCGAEQAEIVRVDGTRFAVPRSALVSLRFRPLDDALLGEWDKAVESTNVADRVIIERDGALDYLEGVLEDVGPEKVRFRLEDDLRELPRSKLTGVAFHRPARPLEFHIAGRLHDRHGAVVAFAKIAATDAGLRVTADSGWSADWPWSDVSRLDYSTGKLLTLTDLAPERNDFTSHTLWNLPGSGDVVRDAFAPRFDRGFDPGPMLLGGKSYARGIALRAPSQVTFRLPEGYRRFTALVGIDDHVRPRGDAVLTLRGDDHTLSKSRITGGEPPTPIDVTITDHHRLTILVEEGQHGDIADIVLLTNPRLSK